MVIDVDRTRLLVCRIHSCQCVRTLPGLVVHGCHKIFVKLLWLHKRSPVSASHGRVLHSMLALNDVSLWAIALNILPRSLEKYLIVAIEIHIFRRAPRQFLCACLKDTKASR